MDERTIILHYHLFKNAGTSVDAILKRNFGDKWVTQEFPAKGGNNTKMVEQWIKATPDAIAYSSHTMLGPIPRVQGVRVISFILLRDPIERIKSAYRFERTQAVETWETQLARDEDFEGYVRARLTRPGDRQCRNFQTQRLARLMPGEGTELDRARRALEELTVVGRVEAFDEAMERLGAAIQIFFPNFTAEKIRSNTSLGRESVTLSVSMVSLLERENADDRALFQWNNDVA